MSQVTKPIGSDQSRSTGNRRAVRNALFRSMMDERPRRKLRECDLGCRTVLGPMGGLGRAGDQATRCQTFGVGPIPYPELASPEYVDAMRALTSQEPLPHPLLRWWRRLLWGE